jgi:hypothetical protein
MNILAAILLFIAALICIKFSKAEDINDGLEHKIWNSFHSH